MTSNPFIYAAQEPVAFFGWLGYALLMLLVAFLATAYAIRQSAQCVALAQRGNRQQAWWGDAFDGWLPPVTWIARVASVLAVLVIAAWAIGSVVWFLGG